MNDDCDLTCVGCGLPWCCDERTSPGEADSICPDCYESEDNE